MFYPSVLLISSSFLSAHHHHHRLRPLFPLSLALAFAAAHLMRFVFWQEDGLSSELSDLWSTVQIADILISFHYTLYMITRSCFSVCQLKCCCSLIFMEQEAGFVSRGIRLAGRVTNLQLYSSQVVRNRHWHKPQLVWTHWSPSLSLTLLSDSSSPRPVGRCLCCLIWFPPHAAGRLGFLDAFTTSIWYNKDNNVSLALPPRIIIHLTVGLLTTLQLFHLPLVTRKAWTQRAQPTT